MKLVLLVLLFLAACDNFSLAYEGCPNKVANFRNGVVLNLPQKQTAYSGHIHEGKTFNVRCNKGYVAKGPGYVRCVNRQWSIETTCVPEKTGSSCDGCDSNGNVYCIGKAAVIQRGHIPSSKMDAQYRVNETEQVECDKDFTESGQGIIRCGEDGQWIVESNCKSLYIDALPEAEQKGGCIGKPTLPMHTKYVDPSRMTAERYDAGFKMSVKCDADYADSWGTSGYVLCCESGVWQIESRCEPIGGYGWPCDKASIPTIPNGNVKVVPPPKKDDGKPRNRYPRGSTLNVTCNSGYRLTGNGLVRCINATNWAVEANCERITCSAVKLPSLENGQFYDGSLTLPSFYLIGETLRAKCNAQYKYTGKPATCGSDGNWRVEGQCEKLKCMELPTIQNGKVPTRRLSRDFTYVGNGEKITCDAGYQLVGGDLAICDETGNWQINATCTRIRCPIALPNFPNGQVLVSEGAAYYASSGIDLVLKCKDGFKVTDGDGKIRCNSAGVWEYSPTMKCKPIAQCRPNVFIPNGQLATPPTSTTVYVPSDEVEIVCNSRSKMIGSGKIRCGANGNWLIETRCELITCPGQLPTIEHGNLRTSMLSISFQPGSVLQVVCDAGYRLESGGVGKVTCSKDGKWEVGSARCVQIVCPPSATIPNGGITLPEGGNPVPYGTEATVTCEKGYQLAPGAISKARCGRTGQWVFSVSTKCCLVKCPAVFPRIANANVNAHRGTEAYKPYAEVPIQCKQGYEIKTGNGKIQCNPDGTWNVGMTRCERVVQCPRGAKIPNGFPLRPTNPPDIVRPGFELLVECNTGYKKVGTGKIRCGQNGKWLLETKCQIATCPQKLPIIEHGSVAIERQAVVGSQFDVKCDINYQIRGTGKLACNQAGQWEIGTTKCVPIPECPPVSPLANSNLVMARIQRFPGSKAKIVCESGYQLVGSEIEAVCGENGQWEISRTTRCEHIVPECGPFPTEIANGIITIVYMAVRGAMYNVTCLQGFNLVGHAVIKCMPDARWSFSKPKCVPKPACGNFPNVQFAYFQIIKPSVPGELDRVIMSCKRGYELVGSSEVICPEGGKWTTQSKCVPKKECPGCDHMHCYGRTAIIPNGFVPRFRLDIPFHSGDNQTVLCRKGFKQFGNSTIICGKKGDWVIKSDCRQVEATTLSSAIEEPPVRCYGQPESLKDSRLADSEPPRRHYEPGTRIPVRCNPGYVERGRGWYICCSDGQWVNQTLCQQTGCEGQLIPESIKDGGKFPHDPNRKYFEVGATVNVTCPVNYTATGKKSIRCNDEGKWEIETTCLEHHECKICMHFHCKREEAIIPHGFAVFQALGHYERDSVEKIQCDHGYKPTGSGLIRCNEFGKWLYESTCQRV